MTNKNFVNNVHLPVSQNPKSEFFEMGELSIDLHKYISSRNAFDSDTMTENSEDSNSTSRFPNYKISPEKIKELRCAEIYASGEPLLPKPTPFANSDSLTISEFGQSLEIKSLDLNSGVSEVSDDYHSSVSHSVRLIYSRRFFFFNLIKRTEKITVANQ